MHIKITLFNFAPNFVITKTIMKKIILTFGLLIVLFISTILLSFGQNNGSTCSNAIPIIPKDSCVSTQFQFIDPGLEM